MTTTDLIIALRRQADIAASTDRGAVLTEAAERLEALVTDKERLDWLEASGAILKSEKPRMLRWWTVDRDDWERVYHGSTARQAIDAARKEDTANA